MNHPHLKVVEGVAYCTSLELANRFGKNHKDVLRSIDILLNGSKIGPVDLLKIEEMSKASRPQSGPPVSHLESFWRRNFAPRDYVDGRGKTQPIYYLTRNGFALLAMGFTGQKALEWKIAYIEAFDAMEAELRRKDISERTLRKIEQLNLFPTDIRQEVRADAAAAALNIAGVFMPPIHSSKIKDLIKKGALEGRFDEESRRWFVYRDSLNAALERKRLKAA